MKDEIKQYFVSDPGGFDLTPNYPSYAAATEVVQRLNNALAEGLDPEYRAGFYTIGVELADGTRTFDFG